MTFKEKVDQHFERLNQRSLCADCFSSRSEFEKEDRQNGKLPTRSNMLLGFHPTQSFDHLDVLVLAESHGGGRSESFYYPNKSFKEELDGLYFYYMNAPIEKFHQQQMRNLLEHMDKHGISWIFTDLVKSYVAKSKDNFKRAIGHCVHYLDEQMSLYKPRIIICMGDHNYSYMAAKFNLPKRAEHGDVYHIPTLNAKLVKVYFPSANTANHWARVDGWEKIKPLLTDV